LTPLYLFIEFLDELAFGAQGALMPLLQTDFHLNYIQIGLLISFPGYMSLLIEPILGILADVWKRRVLILGGGVILVIALMLTSTAQTFYILLFAFAISAPASGAFVSLTQSTWMDADPDRRDHNMARWTFAGSIGVVLGPLALGAALTIGLNWRGLQLVLAALIFVAVIAAFHSLHPPLPAKNVPQIPTLKSFLDGLRNAFSTLRKPDVIRWVILLEFSDLMLDTLLAFLALYFVNIAGLTPQVATLAVAVWTGVGLLGDFLLIPLLEKVNGLAYLRVSVMIELILFPAFLLVPTLALKLILLALLGFFNSGWYAILKAEQYKSMQGQSGSVLVLDNLGALLGRSIPLAIGFIAESYGLGVAMWVLLAGPIGLFFGLPRHKLTANTDTLEK
jgi:FSR family fosmidomycin resistance protein-like MFS transporter